MVIPLPKLPKLKYSNSPMKLICMNNAGEIFATRNFSSDNPVWRKYKYIGWALRYVNGVA